MRNRVPATREERPPLPDFAPVPRRYRHDGWTPERQKAFIEALADCGSVTRAAAQVNMAQANCYALRRAPGAEGFRRAWDAALDFGLKRLKDIAFERAIEGQLVPVFVAGKLMGFRRKRNDPLLMFCLRHYGQDGEGRRTTINYFSTRASAGAGAGRRGGGGSGSVDCDRDERGGGGGEHDDGAHGDHRRAARGRCGADRRAGGGGAERLRRRAARRRGGGGDRGGAGGVRGVRGRMEQRSSKARRRPATRRRTIRTWRSSALRSPWAIAASWSRRW